MPQTPITDLVPNSIAPVIAVCPELFGCEARRGPTTPATNPKVSLHDDHHRGRGQSSTAGDTMVLHRIFTKQLTKAYPPPAGSSIETHVDPTTSRPEVPTICHNTGTCHRGIRTVAAARMAVTTRGRRDESNHRSRSTRIAVGDIESRSRINSPSPTRSRLCRGQRPQPNCHGHLRPGCNLDTRTVSMDPGLRLSLRRAIGALPQLRPPLRTKRQHQRRAL